MQKLRRQFDLMREFGDFGPLDKNTTLAPGVDGLVVVRYYDTDIAVFGTNGAVLIDVGNYNAYWAIQRINALCAPLLEITDASYTYWKDGKPFTHRKRLVNGVQFKRRALVSAGGKVTKV